MGLSICRAEKSVPELMTALECGIKQAAVQEHTTERLASDGRQGLPHGIGNIKSCAEWLRFV